MGLVSNFTSVITKECFQINRQSNIAGSNVEEGSFEEILNKQMENQMEDNKKTINNLDMPNGINIMDLIDISTNNISPTNTITEIQAIDLTNLQNGDMLSTTPEVLTFYPSVFQTKSNMTNPNDTAVFDFERKVAANLYDKFSRCMINDINEFVTDALKK